MKVFLILYETGQQSLAYETGQQSLAKYG